MLFFILPGTFQKSLKKNNATAILMVLVFGFMSAQKFIQLEQTMKVPYMSAELFGKIMVRGGNSWEIRFCCFVEFCFKHFPHVGMITFTLCHTVNVILFYLLAAAYTYC